MSTAEELQEHAEHAHNPFDKRVAASMAIIAAALAVVSVLGHISTTEELLLQQKASDQWSFYQAKSIRRYQSETTRDLFASMGEAQAAKKAEYAANADKYRRDSDEINQKAKELEAESHLRGRQALRLHIGEIFLEIAIVFASLAILTKRPLLYWTAVGSGLTGIAVACTELLVHA
jgi:hypothetical protein